MDGLVAVSWQEVELFVLSGVSDRLNARVAVSRAPASVLMALPRHSPCRLLTSCPSAAFAGFDVGFPGGSDSKASAYNAGVTGYTGLIPGLGISPGGGHGNPLQYSCLENSMVREACWAMVHRVTKNQTQLK